MLDILKLTISQWTQITFFLCIFIHLLYIPLFTQFEIENFPCTAVVVTAELPLSPQGVYSQSYVKVNTHGVISFFLSPTREELHRETVTLIETEISPSSAKVPKPTSRTHKYSNKYVIPHHLPTDQHCQLSQRQRCWRLNPGLCDGGEVLLLNSPKSHSFLSIDF